MRAIVSGGAGFIGSHLVDFLVEKGHLVTVIDNFSTGRPENLSHLDGRDNLKVVETDVTDFKALETFFDGQDWVFHLAALADIVPSIENPLRYHRANVDGTVNMLEWSRLKGIKKFIYAASSSCYGDNPPVPTSEDARIFPQYPYALSKYLGEQCVFHWQQVYGLKANSLRFFNVYGPRARTSGTYGAVLGVFLAQKLAGKPFTVVGDGTQKRDFVFVKDVARALLMAAESDISGEVFNVGTGNPVDINRLASILGGDRVYVPKRPGEPDCTHADVFKILSKLGWESKVGFEEGISECLRNIDYWRNAPVWTPEKIETSTRAWFKYLSK